jgi:predicted ATPase
MALSTAHGFIRWLRPATIMRGWVLAQQGSVEEGIVQVRQTLLDWRTRGGEMGLPHHLASMAEMYGKVGQTEEGLRILAEALTMAYRNEEVRYAAELHRLKGELLLQHALEQNNVGPDASARSLVVGVERDRAIHGSALHREAEACFRQALDSAHQQHAKSLELRSVMSLSRLWQAQGKRAEARQILAEMYGWFTEGFDIPDLQEAKALLEELQ